MKGLRTYLCIGLTKPEFEVSYEAEMELTAILSLKIQEEHMRTLL